MNHPAEPGGRWPRRASILATCLGLVALAASGCQQKDAAQAASPNEIADAPQKVKVHTVQLESWPRGVRVQGSLLSDEISVVGAKVAGRVERVNVDIGSAVRPNDELVALEAREFDLRVEQAEAQLEQVRAGLGLKPGEKDEAVDPHKIPEVVQAEAVWKEARAKVDRANSVVFKNAISVEELQQRQAAAEVAEARYRAALNEVNTQIATLGMRRAELGLARQCRTDAVVRAPFEGVVQQRHVAPGGYVHVGQQVVTLVRVNPLRFRAGIPEREAPLVRLHQPVEVTVEGRRDVFSGQVTRISPGLDMSNRSLVVEADLPNPDGQLRIGLFAEAKIVTDPDARTLAVPATAVREFAGVEKVWVVRKGQAAEQAVQTGRRRADRVEILQGLSVGDVVLVDAQQGRAGPVTIGPQRSQTNTRK
jgi:RND family efflux transporter MFP subunit